ncbi:ABC transporter ATP-binding protein [Bifidobacterium goeldii]|uniref:ABC transporter ATP-binding protein n=1 Tax=Bifidobacterium goeldii TaxID=2306975 RepID=A0A430FLE6_9BIFI|nr:polysaccharide ABC transporter ATP-binding protein [Bifidobacterium goeldii]RSX53676.1 ABC transporter ATP-binding protein [Bifidobacterium goeldii]
MSKSNRNKRTNTKATAAPVRKTAQGAPADRPVALKVDHVYKSFKLPTERAGSLKNTIFNWIRGIRGYRIQEVLKDITFDIRQGEFFGIVGKNGSGKSTLLKLISQIYTPNSGTITTNGKLVPFIELGVGFNPELTGRENVYLNGAMLGFSRDEIDAMYDDIVEFAELGDFMEQKLKNYSSGMQVRLAFSVAIKSQGDILVLDEVLAVGDEAFQKKCQNYFFEAKRQKKTVILVTHSMPDVRRYCDRAMFIQDGRISKIGDPDEIADAYSDSFLPPKTAAQIAAEKAEREAQRNVVTVNNVDILIDGEPQKFLAEKEDFTIALDFACDRDIQAKNLFIDMYDGRNVPVLSFPLSMDEHVKIAAGDHVAHVKVRNVLAFGDFRINIALQSDAERLTVCENACRFHIKGFAAPVMSVINPEEVVDISID